MKRKRMPVFEASHLYRRPGSRTVYARDRHGHYNTYIIRADRSVSRCPAGAFALAPLHGRVDFANGVRFNGRTRSQSALKIRFESAGNKLSLGSVDLPQLRAKGRRPPNQDMNQTMIALTGAARSATEYAAWVDQRHPLYRLDTGVSWEWCHLVAHSMNGGGGPGNIVAAVKGNNSEQLAIESALSMYRCENRLRVEVSAATLDGDAARHIGDVIRYRISCRGIAGDFDYYLDCLNAPNPSQIHYYALLEKVVSWANNKLVAAGPLTATERRLIHDYIREHD